MPSALRPTRRRVLIAAAVLVVLVVAGILLFVGRSGPSGYGDEAHRIYDPVGSCRGVSPDTVRMWPGEARRWCLAFERTSRPDVFVYAPEIGLPLAHGAPEQAAWRLGGRGRPA